MSVHPIALCECPACGVRHRVLDASEAVIEKLRAQGVLCGIVVCSDCGSCLWYDRGALSICEEPSLEAVLPPFLVDRIRQIAARVRARRLN